MALDIARLQAALKANIEAEFGPPNPDDTYLNKYCHALAKSFIEEITAHAELSVTYLDGQYIDSTHVNVDETRTTTTGSVS